MRRTLNTAWFVIWCAALLVTLWGTTYQSQRDLDLVLTWFMIVISFPSSLLTVFITSGLSYLWHEVFHFVGYSKIAEIIINWLIFVSVGWFQWFVVVPWIISKVRKRHRR